MLRDMQAKEIFQGKSIVTLKPSVTWLMLAETNHRVI